MIQWKLGKIGISLNRFCKNTAISEIHLEKSLWSNTIAHGHQWWCEFMLVTYSNFTSYFNLPADILTCDSKSGFKRLLKTHLFNNWFNVAWLTHSQRLCSSAYGALQICLWLWICWQWMVWFFDKCNVGSSGLSLTNGCKRVCCYW